MKNTGKIEVKGLKFYNRISQGENVENYTDFGLESFVAEQDSEQSVEETTIQLNAFVAVADSLLARAENLLSKAIDLQGQRELGRQKVQRNRVTTDPYAKTPKYNKE